MTDLKALMCILGGVVLMMCVVLYSFLFLIYPDGPKTSVPLGITKSQS